MYIYDFPAGPMLKIPHFQCRGLGQGTKIPYATWYSQKKKKKHTGKKKRICVCVCVCVCRCVVVVMGFPGGSDSKKSACSVGDLGLIPGFGRSSGGEHGNPLQYSCWENPHGQRSLGGYSPWGLQRVGHDWATKHTHTHTHINIKLSDFAIQQN